MKQHAPATLRNREPIAAVLAEELPLAGTVLEIASGTGEHAVFLAGRFPALHWQPSDPDDIALASIAAWREDSRLANLHPPLRLDAAASEWPQIAINAVFCCNMAHISPPAATIGVLRGAAHLLGGGEPLIFYGPFFEPDLVTAASNLAFDADLQRRNPAWGIRQIGWLDDLAAQSGFVRTRRAAMPANNLMLVYRRTA